MADDPENTPEKKPGPMTPEERKVFNHGLLEIGKTTLVAFGAASIVGTALVAGWLAWKHRATLGQDLKSLPKKFKEATGLFPENPPKPTATDAPAPPPGSSPDKPAP